MLFNEERPETPRRVVNPSSFAYPPPPTNPPMRPRLTFLLFTLLSMTTIPGFSHAADWPMWRHDAHRSGASPTDLPAKLHLQWQRDNAPLTAAWPDQDKMQFDIVREPIVVGRTMFFNSSRPDCRSEER